MTDDPAIPLAAWNHTPESIPQGGLKTRRTAAADELNALTKALDLVSVDALALDYAIKNAGAGVYRLTGRLTAKVVQSCVVSLEPVPGDIDEELQVEFRPDARSMLRHAKADAGADEVEDLAVDFESDVDVEPITDGRMEVGRIAFETLAAALDPYPRAPGAALDWKDEKEPQPSTVSPFAALAKLKNKS